MKKDEKELKNLLQKKVSVQMDERFWDRFDRTHPEESKSPIWTWGIGASFAAMIVFMLFLYNPSTQQNMLAENMGIIEDIEMLENYDMLVEMEDSMFELSDKEWGVILASN